MKNPPRFIILSVACAGFLAAAAFRCPADSAAQSPTPTPAPLSATGPTPSPLPGDVTNPPAVTAPGPVATAPVSQPPVVSPPAPPVQSATASPIPFNAQNKEIAKSIYQSMRDIQETEFDPAANMTAITKLQDTIEQTDFSAVPQLRDYVKNSLTLNTLRSRDIKIQRKDSGKDEKDKENKNSANIDVGMFTASGGLEHDMDNTNKNENDSSTDVSISSQNDPAVLDKARQQQATAYGLLLNQLKMLGFSRPIDPKAIYGRWRWRCNEDEATYEFDFREDGTVYVKLIADNPSHWVGHGFLNKGRGQWKLDYRALSLEMNAVNLAGFWKQHSLIFFENKEIVNIDDEKMVIATDEDNELKKIADTKK